ncbi:fimbrial protein [Intestinirhabdus alba]|jgi:type 1 fimbria pilin|uniref:Type 1 fimbrial protein n=1 Tax=Intestinirhabdus alba TaxID=2899544 RepID=A0A6L6IDP5_9ENTR|nr:fimbrial protein [Intestinirhabdus alba]MTH44962.1 type 1 fimbrial protein [Intestinirhabdus alba]
MNHKIVWRLGGSLLALVACGAQAATPSEVDGETGVLQVVGSLTESPCRLEMSSAWQIVDMGNIPTRRLQHPGERGRPVPLRLRLRDCIAAPAHNRDERSDNLLWSDDEPAVSVHFTAATDPDNPHLLAVHGVSGLALRLKDADGRDVSLDENAAPLLLSPGQDTLSYTLTTERTAAPLRVGPWHTLLNVDLEYD